MNRASGKPPVLFLACLAVLAGACKGATHSGAPAKQKKESTSARRAAPAPDTRPAGPPPPVLPGSGGAELKVNVKGRGYLRLGKKLAPGRALAGRLATPGWAASADGLERARDDDLRTAWTCKLPTDAAKPPCALGLELSTKSAVHGLRVLFAGKTADGKGTARPKVIRVHTDGGWVEAKIGKSDRLHHLRFDPPLTTRGLVLEVKAVAPSPKGYRVVALAELEVFGSGGKPRPALELDPRMTITTTDRSQFWIAGKASPAWIEVVDAGGGRRRLLRGTEVIGDATQRFLLVRSLVDVDCGCESGGPEQKYSYRLVDRHTRVFYALPKLTGDVLYIIKKGVGFFTLRSHYCAYDDTTYVDSVRIKTSGRVQRRRWRTLREVRLPGATHYAPKAKKCPRLKSAALRRLLRTFGDNTVCATTDRWVVFAGTGGCRPGYSVAATIDKSTGKLIDQVRCKGRFAYTTVRALPGGEILVQVPRAEGDIADLHTINPGGKLVKRHANTFLKVPTTPSGNVCIGMGCDGESP